MRDIGKSIKEHRKKSGMTQTELAEKLSVSYQAVSKWENGVNTPGLEVIADMCKIFGVTLDEFCSDEQDAERENAAVPETAEKVYAPQPSAPETTVQVCSPQPSAAVARSRTIRRWLPLIITLAVLVHILAIVGVCLSLFLPRNYSANEIYRRVNPSVVCIYIERADGNKASGSGFFIDKDGTVVTNYHVVEDASLITVVTVDGQEYPVDLIAGASLTRDIAILKTSAEGVKPVALGNSDAVSTGDKVYAIGYPESFLLGHVDSTFTEGTVSKSSYSVDGVTYIQSTVSITHGNSGGVLVNERAQVVGITTAGVDYGDIDYMNFSIPSNGLKEVKQDINLPIAEFADRYKIYTVNYYVEGVRYKEQDIFKGDRAPNISLPDADDAEFLGWSTSPNSKQLYDFTTPVTGDTNLYAVWQQTKYTVEFSANGGVGSQSEQYVEYGKKLILPDCKFYKDGYRFDCWLIDGERYAVGDEYENTGDKQTVTALAQWKSGTYTMAFSGGNGTVGSQEKVTLKYGEEYTMPECRLTKNDYAFVCWVIDGKEYAAGEKYLNEDEKAEVYAFVKWKLLYYTLSFFPNGGYGEQKEIKVPAGESAQLPECSFMKTGYRFVCWHLGSEDYGVGGNIQNPLNEEKITASAVWKPISYSVIIKDFEGTVLYEKRVFYDQYIHETSGTLEAPEGYEHVGWTDGSHEYGKVAKRNLTVEDGVTVVLTPRMQPITYKIEYNIEFRYAKEQVPTEVVSYGEKPSEPVLTTDSSLKFDGWDYYVNGVLFDGDISYLTTVKDETVTARDRWVLAPFELHLYFYENGGTYYYSTIDPATDKNMPLLSKYSSIIQTPKGKYFYRWERLDFSAEGGWFTYTDDYYYDGGAFDFERIYDFIYEEGVDYIKFCAIWNSCEYTVEFDCNGADIGEQSSKTYAAVNQNKLPARTVSKTGCAFLGWEYGEKIYEEGADLYLYPEHGAVLTFKALWKQNLTGKGTAADPFVISDADGVATVKEVLKFSTQTNYFNLANDIDCQGQDVRVGDFSGVFDGKNHKILNAGLKGGFFGKTKNARISNLGIEKFTLSGGYARECGALIDECVGVTVSQCYADGEITLSVFDGSMSAMRCNGGLIGKISGGQNFVSDCYARGKISVRDTRIGNYGGNVYAAGCIGSVWLTEGTAEISRCYADMDIEYDDDNFVQSAYCGGFIGRVNGGTVIDGCFSAGNILLIGPYMEKLKTTCDYFGAPYDETETVTVTLSNIYAVESSTCKYQFIDQTFRSKEVARADYYANATTENLQSADWLRDNAGFDASVWSFGSGYPSLSAFAA